MPENQVIGSEPIETPGLKFVIRQLVPEAAEALTRNEPVLISGRTGAGKSYILQKILNECKIPPEKVNHVNCAAFAVTILESELFGHVMGAFTGAMQKREGVLLRQGKKVHVLDEIETLERDMQAKLLQFIETGEYRPVGADESKKSPPDRAKIIAITNERTTSKKFRKDFLYRFHEIEIPALHERRHDVLYLLKHFAPHVRWTKFDLLRLLSYHWPGNVRELRRFAGLAERYHHKVRPFYQAGGSVLLYFWRYQGLEYGLERCVPTKGILDQRAKESLPSFLHEPHWAKAIGEFCPHFSFGTKWGKRGKLLSDLDALREELDGHQPEKASKGQNDKVVKSSDFVPPPDEVSSHSAPDNGEGVEESAPDGVSPDSISDQAMGVRWEYEWEVWCELFRQDPHHKEDILSKIAGGKPTRQKGEPTFLDLDDHKSMERFHSLQQKLYHLLYAKAPARSMKEGRVVNGPGGEEALSSAKIIPEEAFRVLVENWQPKKYKQEWTAYWARFSAADAAKKTGVNRKTAQNWITAHRKKHDKDPGADH